MRGVRWNNYCLAIPFQPRDSVGAPRLRCLSALLQPVSHSVCRLPPPALCASLASSQAQAQVQEFTLAEPDGHQNLIARGALTPSGVSKAGWTGSQSFGYTHSLESYFETMRAKARGGI
jgi:hypothetical protein